MIELTVRVTESVRGEFNPLASEIVAVVVYIPMPKPAGLIVRVTAWLFPPTIDPEVELKLSHDAPELINQLSVVLAAPVFSRLTDWHNTVPLPCKAVKLRGVGAEIDKTGLPTPGDSVTTAAADFDGVTMLVAVTTTVWELLMDGGAV
jgi:hypothetical protein